MISFIEIITERIRALQPDEEDSSDSEDSDDNDSETPTAQPPKRKIGGSFRGAPSKQRPKLKLTPGEQISRYTDIDIGTVSNPLAFWSQFSNQLPDLCKLARSLLYIPATSAPVERVFSHGGIIMRPHRARLGDEKLAELIFMKCNMNMCVQ